MSIIKTVNTERRHTGRIFNLLVDEVEYPSGIRSTREVAEHPGGAVVVPLFDDGTVLLVRQYRYPVRKELFELPAGKLDSGEAPELCAARELEEETGYSCASLRKLTAIYTTPGFCSEQLHIYLATGLRESAHGQQLEEGEMGLTLHRFQLDTVLEMIDRGEIVDGKTICGIALTDRLRKSGEVLHSGGKA